MKALIILGLAFTLTSTAQSTGYAPNDGSARAGNPGTYTTDINDPGNQGGVGAEQSTTLESSNTSPNPVPQNKDDFTLQGRTQKGPFKTQGNKQSQESEDEEIDFSTNPKVDHSEENASENP